MGRAVMAGAFIRGKRIFIDFRFEGRRFREAIDEPATEENLAYAVVLRQKLLREIDSGTFQFDKYFPNSKHAAPFSRRNPEKTVAQALDEYLTRSQKTLQRSTIKDYTSSINCHLKPRFGSLRLAELDEIHLIEWISELDITYKRVSNILVPLRHALKDARRRRIIDDDPIDRLPAMRSFTNLLDGNSDCVDPFNVQEIGAILSAMLGQVRNFYQFAFTTGLRTSEQIALKWEDVDFEKKTVRIERAWVLHALKRPKTNAGKRIVNLSTQAIAALEAQKSYTYGKDEFIFHDPDTSEKWSGDGALRKKAWTPALERAGVRYRYPYQTRHTWASLALMSKEHELYVAKQLGHTTVEMVRRHYGKWIDGADPDAGTRVEKTFHGMNVPDSSCP